LMSGTGKTTAPGTTLTSLGRMWQGTTARRQQCPILALTLAPLLTLPIAAVAIACCRSQGRGRPEDIIAMAKTTSPPPPSTDIAARPPPPLKTTTAISMQPLQRPLTLPRPQPSPLPSPLHLLQLLLPSLPSQPLSARRCRHRRSRRRCCCHHNLALASAVTIAAAFANVIAPPTLLSMVGCCVICCPLPAASSAVQICQPPPSCGA
jgi:hypothetical protein